MDPLPVWDEQDPESSGREKSSELSGISADSRQQCSGKETPSYPVQFHFSEALSLLLQSPGGGTHPLQQLIPPPQLLQKGYMLYIGGIRGQHSGPTL